MISVIIPVYNNWPELEKCLASLRCQTFKDFEVIAVDDGSAQNQKCQFGWHPARCGMVAKATKIKNQNYGFSVDFYKIEHGGAPKARNFGFQQSRGEYVLFCDADMELRIDCLMKMKQTLDSNRDRAYVYCDFRYGWKKFKFWPFDPEKLREMNYINTCSLVRREDFPGFDESLEKFQDWDLWLTLLDQDKTGVYIPEILFKANTKKGLISRWLPKIFYKLPFLRLKSVKRYEEWKNIVQGKHKNARTLEH